jgi:hypothetical protein
MPAPDVIHHAVKNALIKEGWTITAEHYTLVFKDVKVHTDIAAERTLAAERAGRKIAVEVKSFLSPSLIHEFSAALGQYEVYREFLTELEPERKLYLAISDVTYADLFKLEGIQFIRRRKQLALLVVNIEAEEVVEWIS